MFVRIEFHSATSHAAHLFIIDDVSGNLIEECYYRFNHSGCSVVRSIGNAFAPEIMRTLRDATRGWSRARFVQACACGEVLLGRTTKQALFGGAEPNAIVSIRA